MKNGKMRAVAGVRRGLALLLVGVMLTVSLLLCSCGQGERRIVMGFDAEYPPFTYVEGSDYVGFDVELAARVFAEAGYQVEYRPIDWDGKDAALTSGAIDCIWSGFTYEGREQDYAWTTRYLDNTIVILTADAGVTTLASLAGRTVAVQSDSSGEAALAKREELVATLRGGAVQTEASYTTAFTKLRAGAYDALAVDVGVARYLLASLSEQERGQYRILEEAVSRETYGVGFRPADSALADEISAAMERVAADTAFIQSLCDCYGVDINSFVLGR